MLLYQFKFHGGWHVESRKITRELDAREWDKKFNFVCKRNKCHEYDGKMKQINEEFKVNTTKSQKEDNN